MALRLPDMVDPKVGGKKIVPSVLRYLNEQGGEVGGMTRTIMELRPEVFLR